MRTRTYFTIRPVGRIFGILTVALLLSATPSAHAQTWQGPNNSIDWENPANWNGGVPGTGGNVGIYGAVNVGDNTLNYTSANALGSLTVDAGAVFFQSSNANNPISMYAGSETVGVSGNGGYYQGDNDTVNTVTGTLTLGVNQGSYGAYTMQNPQGDGGQQLVVGGDEIISQAGSAYFIQYDGANTVTGNLYLGQQAGSMSAPAGVQYVEWTGYNSTVQAANEYVGNGNNAVTGDTADFFQVGGSNSATKLLDVGVGAGSVGTYELDPYGYGASLNAGVEIIGDAGNGTFTQTGGTNVISGSGMITNPNLANPNPIALGTLIVGNQTSPDGPVAKYILQGGTLTAAAEYVGYGNSYYNGAADFAGFNQDDTNYPSLGASNTVGLLDVGTLASGTGMYDLAGDTNSTLDANTELVGDAGIGTLYQYGASVNGNAKPIGLIEVGVQATGEGNYTLGSGGDSPTLNANVEIVGDGGSGQIYQNGGTHGQFFQNSGTNTISGSGSIPNPNLANPNPIPFGSLILGNQINSTAEYDMSGGTLTATNEYIGYGNNTVNDLGLSDSATFNQTGNSSSNGTSLAPIGLIDVGYGPNSIGAYNLGDQYNNSVINATTEIIGDAGYGTFTHFSGTNTISTSLTVGNAAGSTAYYYLYGGTLEASGATEYVGYNNSPGAADVFQNDRISGLGVATNNVGVLDVAYGAGSSGGYELDGDASSTVNASVEVIGDGGYGGFGQSGGINTITPVSGAGSTITTAFGTFDTGSLYLANQQTSTAFYNLGGGTLNVPGTEYVGYGGVANAYGYGGNGSIYQYDTSYSGPSTNNVGLLDLAYNGGTQGTYQLSGDSTSMLNARVEVIGDGGLGQFNQDGGVNTITVDPSNPTITIGSGTFATGNLYLGNQANSGYYGGYEGSGYYNLSGGTLSVEGTEYIGVNGVGSFTQTGGSNTTTNLDIAAGSSYTFSGSGTLNVTNTTISNQSSASIMNALPGTVYLGVTQVTGGGTLSIDPSSVNFTSLSVDATSAIIGSAGDVFTITGDFTDASTNPLSDLSQTSIDFKGNGTHNFNWSSFGSIGGVTMESGGNNLNFSVSGSLTVDSVSITKGSVTVAGPGTVILNGNNHYGDGTYINGGILSVATDANLGSGDITIAGGELLTTGAGSSFNTSKNVTLNPVNGDDTLAAATGTTATYTGVIGGTGALTVGSGGNGGTVVLTANNSYAGITDIIGGAQNTTLEVAADANLGSGALYLQSGELLTTGSSFSTTPHQKSGLTE